MMANCERWSADDYKILQIVLDVPSCYKAVWAMPVDDAQPRGEHRLVAEEIEAFGVVEITTTHYRRAKGHEGAGTIESTDVNSDIAVLMCIEGWWQVANECNNFAGIMKEGQDIEECCGLLDACVGALLREIE